jgi:LAS superfamily LD-carboxypeptidase LdcB
MDWLTSPPPLVEIEPGQYVHEDISKDVLVLKQQAALQSINVNIASGFRSVERQLAIWNAKWSGHKPLLSRDGDALKPAALTDEEKLKAILTWSALPGASRHHWGTDIDVYDKYALEKAGQKLQLVVPEYEHNGPCAALSEWLEQHAQQMGFTRPFEKDNGGVAREPWHLSHIETASRFEAQLDIDALADFISIINISGKSSILQNMDWIYSAYVLNKGGVN